MNRYLVVRISDSLILDSYYADAPVLPRDAWGDPASYAVQVTLVTGTKLDPAYFYLRDARDRLLAACDWTQSTDSPLDSAVKIAWESYRQALRDLPAATADPANPVWPTPPGGAA